MNPWYPIFFTLLLIVLAGRPYTAVLVALWIGAVWFVLEVFKLNRRKL